MALTPEQLAEIQRLKALMQPLATEAQRKAQAAWNAEQMAKAQGKKNGGLQKFLEPSKEKRRAYHGTPNNFSYFAGKPTYVSFDPKFASDYGLSKTEDVEYVPEETAQGASVMPLHVQVENPFDYEDRKHVLQLLRKLRQRGQKHFTKDDLKSGSFEILENLNVFELMKALGHDAFYVNEGYGDPRKNLGVFDPRKIKSAIGNRGTYDVTNPDITKAEGGTMDLDAMRLAVMNKPKHFAQGGSEPRNWAPGHEKRIQNALRQVMFREPALIKGVDTAGEMLEHLKKTTGPEHMDDQLAQEIQRLEKRHAINQWLERNFGNYVKKQMATETDPVRLQAELNVRGFPVAADPGYWARKGETRRKISGGKQMGQSDVAKHWENKTDAMIEAEKAQEHQDMMHLAPGMYTEKDQWVKKLDPEAKLWSLTEHFDPRDLGLDHIRDVLHEDLVSGRIRPEQLNKISMAQAVKRAHEYDEEMEKRRQETAIRTTNDMPMVHEYPESGMKWIELAMPKELPEGWSQMEGHPGIYVDPEGKNTIEHPGKKKLEEALKYEGDTMGHCVGGHGYCEKVKRGQARIFSLRDAKGEPHVTIETQPEEQYNEAADILGIDDPTSEDVRSLRESGRLPKAKERIIQIKGKGNRKPAAKYIPHVQHFVKSGDWSHIGDYENTDLIQVKKGKHATKEEVEALGRHHYPEHNMPAENVLMHYDRMRGMPEMQNEVTKNFIADMEAGNYRMPAPVIKKAQGGTVLPTLEQMKTELMKKAKPDFNDLRNVGINEAPGLDIKAYVPPSRDGSGPFPVGGVSMGDQPLPMGGVDLNKAQPGNQLMPANMAQPAPQAPQGMPPGAPSPLGAAGAPAPQGGSNILQMTPQGQAMAAMKPQGMAEGGIATLGQMTGAAHSPSVPQLHAGGNQLPIIMKDGGVNDLPPVSNQNMDNGATNFSIDNAQQLAHGGEVQRYDKGSHVSSNEYQDLLRRHLAGDRLSKDQNMLLGLYHTISETKLKRPMHMMTASYAPDPNQPMVPEHHVTPEDLFRGAGVPLLGDSTRGGQLLTHVDGKRFRKPVELQSGKDFMRVIRPAGENAGWASGTSVITDLSNKVKTAAEMADKVYGLHATMTGKGADFSSMPTKTLLEMIDRSKIDPSAMDAFDAEIKKFYPAFKGIRSPALRKQLLAPGAGELRKLFVTKMNLEPFQEAGFPDVAHARYAVQHPELLKRPLNSIGAAISELEPSGRIIKTPSMPHYDYPDHLAQERYAGAFDVPMHRGEIFQDWERGRRASKASPSSDPRSFDLSMPIQKFDQEWLDKVMPIYLARRKALLGKKKGGDVEKAKSSKVKMSDNMDTINLELLNKRKKAK